MALVLEQINAEGIAHLSYLIGDDRAGVAAAIDPRRDAEVYLQIARERGLRITHIIETHRRFRLRISRTESANRRTYLRR